MIYMSETYKNIQNIQKHAKLIFTITQNYI